MIAKRVKRRENTFFEKMKSKDEFFSVGNFPEEKICLICKYMIGNQMPDLENESESLVLYSVREKLFVKKKAQCKGKVMVFCVLNKAMVPFIIYFDLEKWPLSGNQMANQNFLAMLRSAYGKLSLLSCIKCGALALDENGQFIKQRVFVSYDFYRKELSVLIFVCCTNEKCAEYSDCAMERCLGRSKFIPLKCVTCVEKDALLFCRRCGLRMYCSDKCRQGVNHHEFFCRYRTEIHTRQKSRNISLQICHFNTMVNRVYNQRHLEEFNKYPTDATEVD